LIILFKNIFIYGFIIIFVGELLSLFIICFEFSEWFCCVKLF